MRHVDSSSSSLSAVYTDILLLLTTSSSLQPFLRFLPLSELLLLNVNYLEARFGRPRALTFFLKENRNFPSLVGLLSSISGGGDDVSSCAVIDAGGRLPSVVARKSV